MPIYPLAKHTYTSNFTGTGSASLKALTDTNFTPKVLMDRHIMMVVTSNGSTHIICCNDCDPQCTDIDVSTSHDVELVMTVITSSAASLL